MSHLDNLLPAPSNQHAPARPGGHKARTRMPRRHRRSVSRGSGRPAPTSFTDSFMRSAPAYLGLVGWIGLLALGVATAATVDRRLRNRLTRRYERYEIRLSMHDDAKPGDLEDMVEALGGAVRKRYNDRVSQGQPFVALELWHRPSAVGLQWTPCLVCEAEMARTLEAIIAGAYPDVRIGREFDDEPRAIPFVLDEPGYVMRFR